MTLLQRLQMASCQLLSQRMGFVQHVVRPSTARTLSSSSVKPFEEIPGPRGIYQLPVIGSIFHFKPFTNETGKTIHRVINSLFDQYGPIVKWKLKQDQVIVSNPKDIETVIQNEGKYPNRPIFDMIEVFAQRNNKRFTLSMLQGEDWYAMRTPLNKRFMKVDSAHFYLPTQNIIADQLIDRFANENLSPEEIGKLFFRFAAESIGVVCFNIRLGFLDKDVMKKGGYKFLKSSQDALVSLQKTVSGESIAHTLYRNKQYRIYEENKLAVLGIITEHLRNADAAIEEQKKNGTFNPDEPNLLNSLLSDNSLVKEDVYNMVDALYSGATDSTGKTMQVFLYNLALNPDKQEKLREEVFRVVGNDQMVTADAIANMPYLKAALKESFRMFFPVGIGTLRVLPHDTVLSGYMVPAQTAVAMYHIRTCRDFFPNPEKYIPERWLRTPGVIRNDIAHRCAVLPFGYGPRSCIGRRFAEQEIYLAVIKMLQKLRIGLKPESHNTNFIYEIFVLPEKPLCFTFTPLSKPP